MKISNYNLRIENASDQRFLVLIALLMLFISACDKASISPKDREKVRLEQFYREGRIKDVRKLIDSMGDANGEYLISGSLLRDAACRGDHRMLRYLLENGANPNWKDSDGESVLISSIRNFQYESVNILLRAGADPQSVDGNNRSGHEWARILWKRDLPAIHND